MKTEYFSTLDTIGDYFTNPLQESLFRKFCNLILGTNEAGTQMEDKKHNMSTITINGNYRAITDILSG